MFGARYPIILAPMGGVGTPELAAAVCNAGGLGSLACAYLTPDQIAGQIAQLRSLTDRPFAVNLFIHETRPLDRDPAAVLSLLSWYHSELGIDAPSIGPKPAEDYRQQIAAVLAARVPVFSFTFGIPDPATLDAIRRAGTKLVGTATTVEESKALAAAGVDAICVQGAEAGAHRGTFLGSFEDGMVPLVDLVTQTVNAVTVPIIAAGGIREGRDIVAMMKLGASAVQIGTAFIPCPESGAAAAYKQAVLAEAKKGRTVVTRAFSGRPARGLPNRFIREMERLGDSILPFPWQNAATRPMRNAASREGRGEFISLWAGEGVGEIRELPAGRLVEHLVREGGV